MPLAKSWPRGALFPVVLASGAPAAWGEWFAYAGRGLYGPLYAQSEARTLCSDGSGEVRVPVAADASGFPVLEWMAEGAESSIGPGLYRVEGSLVVPVGHTLRLRAGTMLFFEGEADLVVDGTLLAEGLAQAPVLLGALDAQRPWGGVVVRGKAVLREIFLETGGGHVARNYGHSQSHPVLDCLGGEARVSHAWIIHNAGKGIGGQGCRFVLDSSLVAWSDMGGEFHDSEVHIAQSSFLFFPDTSAAFRDDDNDALYLYESEPVGADTVWSTVDSSVFYHGLDDGIDHNGALLKVRYSRIGSFFNEGVAASSMGVARIENSVLESCAQGAEAGYGAPLLELHRVLLRSNRTGARLGDSYRDWVHQGRLYIDSSAFAANVLDILNQPGDTETVQEAQVWAEASQLRTGKDFGGKSNTAPSADDYARAAYEWPQESYTTGPTGEVKLWFEP